MRAADPARGPFPPPHELTSHQPPALLVAELLAADADGGAGRARLLNPAGLDLLQLVEGGAQTLAVLMGHVQHAGGGGAASGMLVGMKDVRLTRVALPGETVEVAATLVHRLGPFRLYAVRATAGGEELLSAELKTVSTGGTTDEEATP